MTASAARFRSNSVWIEVVGESENTQCPAGTFSELKARDRSFSNPPAFLPSQTEIPAELSSLDGIGLPPVAIEGITSGGARKAQVASAFESRVRLVAHAARESGNVRAHVRLQKLDCDDALAKPTKHWNVLQIGFRNGAPIEVSGRGCGRWPITEA